MDQKILNNLNDGEQIVEMTECELHDETVIKVVYYKCHVTTITTGFWKPKTEIIKNFDKYEFPFYFSSKEFAQEFIENMENFEICDTTYYDVNDLQCYKLELSKYITKLNYIMVDDFKYRNRKAFRYKCQLESRGVWGGLVNTDARYAVGTTDNLDYKDIFKFENIAIETEKSYVYKLVSFK